MKNRVTHAFIEVFRGNLGWCFIPLKEGSKSSINWSAVSEIQKNTWDSFSFLKEKDGKEDVEVLLDNVDFFYLDLVDIRTSLKFFNVTSEIYKALESIRELMVDILGSLYMLDGTEDVIKENQHRIRVVIGIQKKSKTKEGDNNGL